MAEMKIQMMDIDSIHPYENNPRKNEKAIEAVANSIEKFGFKNPIIVDKDNVIISGHTRRLASIALGLRKVPVIVGDDLTEEEVKAFRLADNRVAELAVWDEDLLKEEMSKVLDMNLVDFGFDTKVIDEILEDDIGIVKHRCPKCGCEFTERDV